MIPSVGPMFAAPDMYSSLPETGTSALQQALIYERHDALAGGGAQSIAAFASLHVSVVFTAALIATLLKVNRVLRYALWVYLGLTMVATLYFGWHYVADDLAGIVIGADRGAGRRHRHRPHEGGGLRSLAPVVPNVLTVTRIAVVPLMIWVLIWDGGVSLMAAALFAIASLSDFYDGYLARRWGVTSSFGALLDPFADKLLVLELAGRARSGRPRAVVDRRSDRRPRGVGDHGARPGAAWRGGRRRRHAGQAQDVRAVRHVARC